MPLHFTDQITLELICRLIGLFGVLLYIAGFLLLSAGKVDSSKPGYFTLVFLAACCVMISLCIDFNMSSALIQLFYIAMSLGAILLRIRSRRKLKIVNHFARME